MKRKIIKLAENTFVISLPSSFIKRYKLNKGDELDTELLDDKLVIYTSKHEDAGEIHIDIRKLDNKVVRWLIAAIYKKGYDALSITLDKSQKGFVLNELKECIGFSIMEEKDNLLTVKSIIKENKEDIHNVLRRAFRITIKMANELSATLSHLSITKKLIQKDELSSNKKLDNIQLTKTKFNKALPKELLKQLNDIKKYEFENNQLVNFCERIINKKSDLQAKEKTFYYVIIWNLEKICDNFKYICGDILELSHSQSPQGTSKYPSKQELDVFDKVNSLLESYYSLFYNFNIEKMNSMVNKINELKDEIKKIKTHSTLLMHLSLCLQQIADLSSSYIGVNLK